MPYDPRRRPAQPETPKPDAFEVRRAEVRDGLSLAYVREGVGGYPLLLVHGYPETKRIWWRNVVPLVEAGYEVIVPDLRGFGDSDLSPDDAYDIAIYSRDLERLVRDVCGHDRIGAVGGDVGGVVLVDLLHRFPGLVERLVFFNTVPPLVPDRLAAAGLDPREFSGLADSPTGDYRLAQGAHPDELAARLNTEALRRGWIADMYGHRLWASPGTFSAADVDFMTEPFGDEARLRASWAVYQLGHDRPMSEAPLLGQPVATPTLVLYGSDDHVVGDDFVHYCEAVFDERVGPLVVPGAGHFLQWERADIVNPLVARFFADLRPAVP